LDKGAKSYNNQLFYEVEDILDRKRTKGRFYYKIKWKGYPISECTWEPLSHLQYTKDLVAKFNAKMDGNKLASNSNINKENENSDNKIKGRKKILQKKSKLLTDDFDYVVKTMNLKEEEEEKLTPVPQKPKEQKSEVIMNDQRRKLRSSDVKKDEEMLQKELINKIERPKEKIRNKYRNMPRNKGRFRKSLSRPRPVPKIENIEKKVEEKKVEEKKNENIFEKKEEKEEVKEMEKTDEKEQNLNRKMFFIDEDYKEVLGIKMENQQLIAVVAKKGAENKTEMLNTKRLKTLNPWILIDYYENRINFE